MSGDDGVSMDDLNLYSGAFVGPAHLFPLNPAPVAHRYQKIPYSMKGYTAPEKLAILSPEMHMEYNDLWTYKNPRTPFYVQTDADIQVGSNQDKLEKI